MSQTTTYVPQAGTIPAKVIAHLQTLPPGAELSTAMVLEAIGQPAGWHGLTACLKTAVDHGVISKRQDRGGWMMWGLVDPAAAKPAAHAGQGVDIDRVRAKPTPLSKQDIEGLDPETRAWLSRGTDDLKPATESASTEPAGAADEADLNALEPGNIIEIRRKQHESEAFECALTNNGRLLIQDGDARIALSPDKAQALMAYLDEQRGIEWEAA